MGKRLTDTEKWGDAWFMDLPSKYKIFWLYMLDSCDIAGIWEVNWKMAQFITGETLEPSEVKRFFSGRIIEIDDGRYWFIKKFIFFQQRCEVLNLKNKCHLAIYKLLQEHNLLDLIDMDVSEESKPLLRGFQGASKPLPRGYSNGNSNGKSIVINNTIKKSKKSNMTNVYVDDEGCDDEPENQITHISDQASFIESFSALYENQTGHPFKSDKKHFVIIANLIKKYGYDATVEKAKLLAVYCQQGEVWFAREGWSCFTPETLSAHWNRIVPILSDEQKKELKNKAVREKIAEHERKVNELLKNPA